MIAFVGSVGFEEGDFSKFKGKQTTMSEKISDLWTKKREISSEPTAGSIVIPCWKTGSEIPKMKADGELLFVDNDAIDKGKIFDEADKGSL